jgi:hypothetical protein
MIPIVLAAIFASGCASVERHVLLKEFASSVPQSASQPLKGKTVCIRPFTSVPSFAEPDVAIKPEQLPEFVFVRLTSDQEKLWREECRNLRERTDRVQWWGIGTLYAVFKRPAGRVYALNDPGTWLAETLKMDLEARGAKVLDISQVSVADISLYGHLNCCWVESYLATVQAHLVLDLECQPKDGVPFRRVWHTTGRMSSSAFVGSGTDLELYQALRESRQQISWLTVREIQSALEK